MTDETNVYQYFCEECGAYAKNGWQKIEVNGRRACYLCDACRVNKDTQPLQETSQSAKAGHNG